MIVSLLKVFRRRFPLWFALLVLVFSVMKVAGQGVCSGQRIAVFDVVVLQQKNQKLSLRCRMANTGRKPLQGGRQTESWVVEFDTLGLPALLRGFEDVLAEAVKENAPALRAGELSGPVWLDVKWSPRQWKGASGCANLIFDTLFLESWTASAMRLRYKLRNTGAVPANFFGKNAEPLLKAYFVSGEKLTRGAIPAGITSIRKGRETLDGQLWPGQVLEGFMELETKNRTRFSPNIALELDPAQAVDECSRTDNVGVIRLQGL